MKWLGLTCIVLCCSLCGAVMAAGLKKRAEALKKVLLFLHLLTDRLRYTLSPVDEIFTALAAEPLLSDLDFIPACAGLLSQGLPFPQALGESVEDCRCALDKRDRSLLGELCGIVGASDLESQMEGISLVRTNMADQLRTAQEDAQKRARLYASLGVLTGAAAAIVLI